MSKHQYPKQRHDSAGTCVCGWPLDKFGQCTDVECELSEQGYDCDEEDE